MFRLLSSAYRRNPYPAYWLLRKVKPLVYLSKFDLWFVSRYDAVKRVLSDYADFSSDFGRLMQTRFPARPMRTSLIASDPPVHTTLRGLLARGFTPRAIANLEPRIVELTNTLLDQVVAQGRIDLVGDLAYPLPVIVIAELLGIPPADREQFKRWSDQVIQSADRAIFAADPGAELPGATVPMSPEVRGTMEPYLLDIIAQRRAAPRDDLISRLVTADVDGERLTAHDLLAFTSLLLVAGNVTTTNLITNAIATLLQHPAELAKLRADLSLLPSTIEEVLRYRSPVQFMFRVTAREVELGGKVLPAGQRVIALIGSANRDDATFANPNTFDITRSPNPHLAFGHGVHYCLGAPLARLEATVALPLILQRLPDLARVGRGPLPPTDGLILHGSKRLPLRFRPPTPVSTS